MKIIIFSLFIIFALLFTDFDISKDEVNIVNLSLKELNEQLAKDNNNLWNYSLIGHIMFISKKRVIIANKNDNNNSFERKDNLFFGYLPKNINVSNTSIVWHKERWAMISLPLPKKRIKRLDLLIHESFHRIQPYIGFDSLYEIPSKHLNTEKGRIFLKLEFEALKKALNSSNSLFHIKNAILFRLYRYKLFLNAKKSENSLEINEGLAEFTATTLSGRTDSELKKHLYNKLNATSKLSTFVRSFAYYTIPVYGYLMRKKDNKWNLNISKNSNLTDFIIDFYKIDTLNLNKNKIIKIGINYNIDSIESIEKINAEKRKKEKENYKKIFEKNVISIPLINMHIGFNPSNIFPLDTFGTVYPNLRITDKWGVLKVDSIGALITSKWDSVKISYPIMISDTIIEGDYWTLKINKYWEFDSKKKTIQLKK